MSAAPFDIQDYFDANGDELELHEVFVQGAEPDPGGWIEISGDHRRLDSTMLVVLFQRGARRIAVKHEDRVVEFDLRGVILRDGSMDPVEREASSSSSEMPLWLPAAVYRLIADPYGGPTHRNMLRETLSDFPPELIDAIVDSLIEYGIVREAGATERAVGDLTIVPEEEQT